MLPRLLEHDVPNGAANGNESSKETKQQSPHNQKQNQKQPQQQRQKQATAAESEQALSPPTIIKTGQHLKISEWHCEVDVDNAFALIVGASYKQKDFAPFGIERKKFKSQFAT